MIPIKVVEAIQPDKASGGWTQALVDAHGGGDIDAIVNELCRRYPKSGVRLIIFNHLDYAQFSNTAVKRGLKECLELNYDLGVVLCKRILLHRRQKKKAPTARGFTLQWVKGPELH